MARPRRAPGVKNYTSISCHSDSPAPLTARAVEDQGDTWSGTWQEM